MAELTRDPRIDPARNDIVRSRKGIPSVTDFLVVDNDGEVVTYVENGQHVQECPLWQWRENATNDEIVRRGDGK